MDWLRELFKTLITCDGEEFDYRIRKKEYEILFADRAIYYK